MFKKRTAKKRISTAFEADDNEEAPQSELKSDELNEQVTFRKRDFKGAAKRVNVVSTSVQDCTSKDFMRREVQDLTNNYKSSSKAKEMQQIHKEQTEKFLREEEEKDGLFYAKQN